MSAEWKEVRVTWNGGMRFTGANLKDGQVEIGTQEEPGISPMELILVGLAGCTAVDVVSILRKKRQEIADFEVTVRGKRAETHPRVYTEIEITYQLWSNRLDPKAVEQAIRLSEEKYCSASAMLGAVAQIHSEFVIHPTASREVDLKPSAEKLSL